MPVSSDLIVISPAIDHWVDTRKTPFDALGRTVLERYLAQAHITIINRQSAVAVPAALADRDAFAIFEYGSEKNIEPVRDRSR